jgi:hypothetical protein
MRLVLTNEIWDRLFEQLPIDGATAEVRRLFVDSTTVRSHPHVAGAVTLTARQVGAAPHLEILTQPLMRLSFP